MQLNLELLADHETGPCACCDERTRSVAGLVRDGDVAHAAYFVRWTPGRRDHAAHFDLLLGAWGEGTTSQDRVAVSLAYVADAATPGFAVVDAGERPVADSDLSNRPLARDAVVGTPWADQAYRVVDAIWLGDERISEIRSW